MESGRPSDGSAIYDDSFPEALDEKFQKIKAFDAVKLRKSNPNAIFYCPKCYKLDSNKKTKLDPSNHNPPRFNRINGASHLDTCQYKKNYFINISQKIGINIEGKVIELSLMPYEGRGIGNRKLGSKLKQHLCEDHKKFMELVRYILMDDYEFDFFQKKYSQFKIQFQKGKSQTITKLVNSIESVKTNFKPYEEKLNIVVGKIKEVSFNDYYVFLDLDDSNSTYSLRLYLDRFFYDPNLLLQLKDKRVCSMGYVVKTQVENLYAMHILSIPHQMAFLDHNSINLDLQIQTKELVSFLEYLTEGYEKMTQENFYRSYYSHQLILLQSSTQSQLQLLENQLKKVNKEQLQVKENILKLDFQIEQIVENINEIKQERLDLEEKNRDLDIKMNQKKLFVQQLEKESQGWWIRLRNMIDPKTIKRLEVRMEDNRNEIHENQEYQQRQQEKIVHLIHCHETLQAEFSSLESNLSNVQKQNQTLEQESSDLLEQINEIKRQVQNTKELSNKENQLKKKFKFEGELFELSVNADWSIILDISIKYSKNGNVECLISAYCVEKIEGYYIPYEFNHSNNLGTSMQKQLTSSSNYGSVK